LVGGGAACRRDTIAIAPADASPVLASGGPDAGPHAADASAREAGTRPTAPTSRERSAFLRLLNEGRALSQKKDWDGAAAVLERARELAPHDAHVLSELGWAALHAKKLDRAHEVTHRALMVAREPKLRAQVLYNAGRIAEARGDRVAARKAYRESLTLRDNDEVKRALGTVGDDPAADPLPCAQDFDSTDALCACLLKSELAQEKMGRTDACKLHTKHVADGRLFILAFGPEDPPHDIAHFLGAREGTHVRLVVDLGHTFEPGAFGVHNETTITGTETRTAFGHTVVTVRTKQDDNDYNAAGLELCSHYAKNETLCALEERVKCTRPIPLETTSGCGPGIDVDPKDLDDDAKRTLADIHARATKASATIAYTLEPTGRVSVKLVRGSKTLLPPDIASGFKLW
jgi:tetratricopeptide (TPR) repeat protein